MKRLFIVILALTVLLGSTGSVAAAKRPFDKLKFPELNKFKLPEIQKISTNNGIKLRLIKDDKLPLITLQVFLKGGDLYDPISKVDLAYITAQLLRIGGTKGLTGDELDKFLDSNGISISITSRDDYFRISLSCLEENFDQALSILAKILREPAFADEKLEEIKTKESTNISRRNENPGSINRREFNKLIYGADSLFAATIEYEHLDNISKSDVIETYKKFFAADNMLVGVTGPLEINEVKQLFEKYFGTWDSKAQIPPFPKVKEQAHDFKVAYAEKSGLTQSYFSIGHLGVKEDMTEKAKIMVFNTIFSQGFTSRLNTRIRVKMGLTYGARGSIDTEHLYPGKTSFSTYTKCKSTLQAIKAMYDEIEIIRKEKVGEQELKDAKDYLLNSYVFEFSTPSKILSNSLEREFYQVDENEQKKLVENIGKVSAEDVMAVARQYLHPDKMVIFVVGNEKLIKEGGDLSELGKVKKIDISIKPPTLKEKIPPATPEMLEKGKGIITSLLAKYNSAYKRLKSLEIQSDRKMTMGGRTLEMGSKTTILYPDKRYTEISVMGMKMHQIINGNKGVLKRMGQEIPISAEDIAKGKFGDLYDIFYSQEKGKYNFQYLKEETIDGKTYDVIYVFDAEKNWVKLFINRETQMIEIEEKLSQQRGQSGVQRQVKSDFRIIKGIPFAFKSEVYVKDKKTMETTIKDIKINPKVDPSIFKIK